MEISSAIEMELEGGVWVINCDILSNFLYIFCPTMYCYHIIIDVDCIVEVLKGIYFIQVAIGTRKIKNVYNVCND